MVGEHAFEVKAGDRIHIPPGSYHGIKTTKNALHFMSFQMPPILNKKTGQLDLEELVINSAAPLKSIAASEAPRNY